MALDFSHYVDEIEDRIESPATAMAAAKSMAEVMRKATAGILGGDLGMSGLRGGRARFETKVRGSTAIVEMGGAAFTLADKGRRTASPAKARRGSALATPFGPRASVKGSTSAGKDIVGHNAARAFKAGTDAVIEASED